MKQLKFSRIMSLLLAVLLVFSGCGEKKDDTPKKDYDETRYTMLTFHSGDKGHFEDGSRELESLQFRGDRVFEDRKPIADTAEFIFLGWSTEQNAEEPNVDSGFSEVNNLPTDIYAVWSDKAYVVYETMEGYYEKDGAKYGQVFMEYKVGMKFQPVEVKSFTDLLVFDGWYTGIRGAGEKVTEQTVINSNDFHVYAFWKYNKDIIPAISVGDRWTANNENGALLYSFTPTETGVYELYSENLSGEWADQLQIGLMDDSSQTMFISFSTDYDGNASCPFELEAGKTYFYYVDEIERDDMVVTLNFVKPETVTVNLHTNVENAEEACFDGVSGKSTSTYVLKKGVNVKQYGRMELDVINYTKYNYIGWATSPDAPFPDTYISAEEGMDLYAVYNIRKYITLDANGGRFTLYDGAVTYQFPYDDGDYFLSEAEPKIDDITRSFSGWATTPDAKEPDIIETKVLCSDLPDTIYAVYGEKVLTTFEANGGYMMDNPNATTYSSSRGKNHMFFGMSMMHENSRMVPYCFVDHKGVEIPYTSQFNPDYTITEDTVFTCVWGFKVHVDANGGCFFEDEEFTALAITYRYEGTFDGDVIPNLVGDPTRPGYILKGYATTADATEPDVISGKTPIKSLDRIYAVWEKAPAVQQVNSITIRAGE